MISKLSTWCFHLDVFRNNLLRVTRILEDLKEMFQKETCHSRSMGILKNSSTDRSYWWYWRAYQESAVYKRIINLPEMETLEMRKKRWDRRETLDSWDYTWLQQVIGYLVCVTAKTLTQILHFAVSLSYNSLFLLVQEHWKWVDCNWFSIRILILKEQNTCTKGSLIPMSRINVQVLWIISRSFIASS